MKLVRLARIQLAVFALVTVLGISYAVWSYGGLQRATGIGTYDVAAEFSDAGGLYPRAIVTYRGADIGVVRSIDLRPNGVSVSMQLKSERKVPSALHAYVKSVSAIGEQYVDLVPDRDGGPFLKSGSVISQKQTTPPTSVNELLSNTDDLLKSVPVDKLRTVISESHDAFDGTGPAIRTLIAQSQKFIELAQGSLPQTLTLIDQGEPVLDAINSTGRDIRGYATDLASFTEQLKMNDGQIRSLLRDGPGFADTVSATLDENAITIPALLGDLQAVGQTLKVYAPSLQQILVVYPALASSLNSATKTYQRDDDLLKAQAGLDVKLGNTLVPPPCTNGYQETVRRDPSDVSKAPAKFGAFCDIRRNDTRAVRGARNLPCMTDPRVRTAFVADCPGGLPSQWSSTQSTILAPPQSAAPQIGEAGTATTARRTARPASAPYDPASGRVTLADGSQIQIPALATGASRVASLKVLLLGGIQ